MQQLKDAPVAPRSATHRIREADMILLGAFLVGRVRTVFPRGAVRGCVVPARAAEEVVLSSQYR